MKEFFITVVLAGFGFSLMQTTNSTATAQVTEAPHPVEVQAVRIEQIQKSEPVQEKPVEISPILKALKLPDCEISLGEKNHHKADHGHIFATDIDCNAETGFNVYAPDLFPFYQVQHQGTDKRLGTYVILKHGEDRFIFAHTDGGLAGLDDGQRLNAGQMVGYTNDTGISSGNHLHIERWQGKKQISWTGQVNEFSEKLCDQRGWSFCKESPPPARRDVVIARSSEMVRHFEGFKDHAYEDPKGSGRWSIGHGTPSFKGEVITAKVAIDRFNERLFKTVDMVRADFPNYSEDQQVALVSLAYNCGIKGYPRLKAEGLKVYSDPKFCTLEGYSGLNKRRDAEKKLLFQ